MLMCMTRILSFFLLLLFTFSAHAAEPAWQHALTRYGAPKYAADFKHFDYVNPSAPVGGTLKLAEAGTFDSLNPFILSGVKAPGFNVGALYSFESLMTYALDEPQSMYGLLADKVRVAADNAYVEFHINPAARWHDGSKVTAEDVVFSFNSLKEKGDPVYRMLYAPVASAEALAGGLVRFTFTDKENKELPQMMAAMPVFSKAYYSQSDFTKTSLTAPLGSGPYKVEAVDAGRSITFQRVKNYWGWSLPVMRGMYNFERIHIDLYRDENVMIEAFKAGSYDVRQEYIARNWATAYQSPALTQGKFIKKVLQDKRPQGMQAFVFNTRLPKFQDRRVREAIGLTMDFEWLNAQIFYGAYKRNTSFFMNTPYAAPALPDAAELKFLEPYRDSLPPSVFDSTLKVPHTDGSGNARPNLLRAQALLNEAGFSVRDGKRIDPATGKPLEIEFLLTQPTMERVIGPMRKNLERLGIAARIRMVDTAQYQKRTDQFDYEIISLWINRGVFYPGNEQKNLWHSTQVDVRGGNHLSGYHSPLVDMLVESIASAKDDATLLPAARALDRVLMSEYVVIPHWYSGTFRMAYWNTFGQPETTPPYSNGVMTWWVKP